jgi:hypothetical protein
MNLRLASVVIALVLSAMLLGTAFYLFCAENHDLQVEDAERGSEAVRC